MRDDLERLSETLEAILDAAEIMPGVRYGDEYLEARLLRIRQLAAGALCELKDLELIAEDR